MSKQKNNPDKGNQGRDKKPDTFGKEYTGDSKRKTEELRKGSEIPPKPPKK